MNFRFLFINNRNKVRDLRLIKLKILLCFLHINFTLLLINSVIWYDICTNTNIYAL